MEEEERQKAVKHRFLSKLRREMRDYVSLEVEKWPHTNWKLSLALDLGLQTHGWEASLLQLTKVTKFLQVITAVFIYRYLFKREET